MCVNVCFVLLKMLLNKILKHFLSITIVFVIVFFLWTVKWDYNSVIDKIYLRKEVSVQNVFYKEIPVIVWWNTDFGTGYVECPGEISCSTINREKNDVKPHHADAYLFYGSKIDFNDLPLPRRPKDVIWGLSHEESPRNVDLLLHEKVLNIFNFSATFSRHSDVPFPLQYLRSLEDITSTKYFVKTKHKNEYLKDISPILYLQSDCETSTERDAYVKELMKLIPIDSYGACLNNKVLPKKFKTDYLNNLYEHEFLKLIAKYKFVIAIENGVCNDYITEKFWRPITVGSVPIYFGSPLIRDWLPNNKSGIILQDYSNPTRLYEHLKRLMNNDTLYEEYLEHKIKKLISNSRIKEELTLRPYQVGDLTKVIRKFECFICQVLHDKRKGILHENIVNKSHYDCPKPISALTFESNSNSIWVLSWEMAKEEAERINRKVMSNKN